MTCIYENLSSYGQEDGRRRGLHTTGHALLFIWGFILRPDPFLLSSGPACPGTHNAEQVGLKLPEICLHLPPEFVCFDQITHRSCFFFFFNFVDPGVALRLRS